MSVGVHKIHLILLALATFFDIGHGLNTSGNSASQKFADVLLSIKAGIILKKRNAKPQSQSLTGHHHRPFHRLAEAPHPLKAFTASLLAFNNMAPQRQTPLHASRRATAVSMEEDEQEMPPDGLSNLLCQCAIQARQYYCNELNDGLQAWYLNSFLNHTHLRVERTDGRGGQSGGVRVYKGLNGLNNSHNWRDYFRTMLEAPDETYTVDNVFYQGRVSNNVTVRPVKVADYLMMAASSIADEWTIDLRLVANDAVFLDEVCRGITDDERFNDTLTKSDLGNLHLARTEEFKHEMPKKVTDLLYNRLALVRTNWGFGDSGPPTPFRSANVDLLQRAVTREAAVRVVKEFEEEMDNPVYAASALWLRRLLLEYQPLWEEAPRGALGNLFLIELITSSPETKELTSGGVGITDPHLVSQMVIQKRKDIAEHWSRLIGHSRQQLLSLRDQSQASMRDQLERRFAE